MSYALRELFDKSVQVGTITVDVPLVDDTTTQKGGPGSGHHGHAGRPGEVGGSQAGTAGTATGWQAVVQDNSNDPAVKSKMEDLDIIDDELIQRMIEKEHLVIRGEGVDSREWRGESVVAFYDGDKTIVIGPKQGFSISSAIHEFGHMVGQKMGYNYSMDHLWDNPDISQQEDLKSSLLGKTIARLYENLPTQGRQKEFFAESFAMAHKLRPDELDRLTSPRWGAFIRKQFLKGGWKNLGTWETPRAENVVRA